MISMAGGSSSSARDTLTMAASTPGTGRPMEPGRTRDARKLAIMMAPVSVCHQVS